jgi:hypothetical protein
MRGDRHQSARSFWNRFSVVAAILLFGDSSNAALIPVQLTDAFQGGGQEYTFYQLSGTTSGIYDDVANTVTMNSGSFAVTYAINPAFPPGATLSTETFSNASWDLNAAGLTVTGYSCADGGFGPSLTLSYCGGYNWGGNNVDDSALDYGTIPGALTIGGDDVAILPVRQASDYESSLRSWNGDTLVIQTALWDDDGTTDSPLAYQLTFATVPIPAAAWLFASALGLLGWTKRQRA